MDSRYELSYGHSLIVDEAWRSDSLSDADPMDIEENLDFNKNSTKAEENLDFRAMLQKSFLSTESWNEQQLESFFSESISTN